MTPKQERIAEELVERMKQDDEGSIGWVKHQELHKLAYNDVFLAVQGLKDIDVVEEYPERVQSIRFVSPYGNKFTTFKKYRRKKAIVDFPKNFWWVVAIVTFIAGKDFKCRKVESSQQPVQQFQQDVYIYRDTCLNKQGRD